MGPSKHAASAVVPTKGEGSRHNFDCGRGLLAGLTRALTGHLAQLTRVPTRLFIKTLAVARD